MRLRVILRVAGLRSLLLACIVLPLCTVAVRAQQITGAPSSMDLMFAQFAKYQVLPLDASVATRMMTPRPSLPAGRKRFDCSNEPVTSIPWGTAPTLLNTSYAVTADIDIPQSGAEGMIVTGGRRFGGYGFYLLASKPVFTWNRLDFTQERWQGSAGLSPGKHRLASDFRYDGPGFATLAFNNLSGLGRLGTGILKVDGQEVTRRPMGRTVPLTLQWDETPDIGSDTGTPVDDWDYRIPFRFTGRIDGLIVEVEAPQLKPDDVQKLEAAYRAAQDAT
jgi:arylsulfatase